MAGAPVVKVLSCSVKRKVKKSAEWWAAHAYMEQKGDYGRMASMIKHAFEELHKGSWQVIVGREFTLNVRADPRGSVLLALRTKPVVKVLCFRSAPSPLKAGVEEEKDMFDPLDLSLGDKLAEVHSSGMDEEMTQWVAAVCANARSRLKDLDEVTARAKERLIRRYGPTWQLVTGKAKDFSAAVSGEKGRAISLSVGSTRFVIFQHISKPQLTEGIATLSNLARLLFVFTALLFLVYLYKDRRCKNSSSLICDGAEDCALAKEACEAEIKPYLGWAAALLVSGAFLRLFGRARDRRVLKMLQKGGSKRKSE